jgi:hypothetical protein
MHLAALEGHASILMFLLDAGAMEFTNGFGETPLRLRLDDIALLMPFEILARHIG